MLGLHFPEKNEGNLRAFLDFKVETPILCEFLDPEGHYFSFFYNGKVTGTFLLGNTFGGTPQSGQASHAICFENYAWESISAAAKSLKKDRKSIRNRLERHLFQSLSKQEFEEFQGFQILNKQADTFFDQRAEELHTLLQRLGFRL